MVCLGIVQQQKCAKMGRSWARRRTAQIGEQQNWGQKSRIRARRSRFRAKKSRLRAKQITTRTREGAEMELVRRKSRRGCGEGAEIAFQMRESSGGPCVLERRKGRGVHFV
ncbi:hypothetical protein Adt_19440 [Abeliophyllum distichum]|uniref:Uncharacterized protein n=1 Tax=Abeliophyllum distichum TaxID=126358 RepID=A0ABD1SUI9_9LAMI